MRTRKHAMLAETKQSVAPHPSSELVPQHPRLPPALAAPQLGHLPETLPKHIRVVGPHSSLKGLRHLCRRCPPAPLRQKPRQLPRELCRRRPQPRGPQLRLQRVPRPPLPHLLQQGAAGRTGISAGSAGGWGRCRWVSRVGWVPQAHGVQRRGKRWRGQLISIHGHLSRYVRLTRPSTHPPHLPHTSPTPISCTALTHPTTPTPHLLRAPNLPAAPVRPVHVGVLTGADPHARLDSLSACAAALAALAASASTTLAPPPSTAPASTAL